MYDIISYEVHNFLSYIYISKYTRTKIISVSYISSVHSVSVYKCINHKKIFSNAHRKKNYAKKKGGGYYSLNLYEVKKSIYHIIIYM